MRRTIKCVILQINFLVANRQMLNCLSQFIIIYFQHTIEQNFTNSSGKDSKCLLIFLFPVLWSDIHEYVVYIYMFVTSSKSRKCIDKNTWNIVLERCLCSIYFCIHLLIHTYEHINFKNIDWNAFLHVKTNKQVERSDERVSFLCKSTHFVLFNKIGLF